MTNSAPEKDIENESAAVTPENGASSDAQAATEKSADQKILELENQVKEKENKYLYLYAEFENYKKRMIKERSDLVKFGWENVARDLLQVVDNLERALQFTPPETDKNLVMGLNMVLADFRSTLQRQGVQKIDSTGQTFNPELHEGVSNEVSAEHPAGIVLKEHLPGYMLHGRLLRPSKVVVSSGPNA